MRRILVVDGADDDREILATLVRHAGYSVEAVATLEDARAAIVRERSDLLVLDLDFPTWIGQFAGWARSHSAPPPAIIAVSNHLEIYNREILAAVGFAHALQKPVDPPRFWSLLSRIVSERHEE